MPLSVCSGGACHSIYLSTVTSILSSFSVPLTVVVPFLNYLGFAMQLVGLLSIYTANKWKSVAFWVYLVGMLWQLIMQGWIGCVFMIAAVLLNAKTNTFTFGKKLFKDSIFWMISLSLHISYELSPNFSVELVQNWFVMSVPRLNPTVFLERKLLLPNQHW